MRSAVISILGSGPLKQNLLKISPLLCALTVLISASNAEAYTSLSGFAQLSYIKYKVDAEADKFSGDSFAQAYSLSYSASNLVHREQPRYYDLRVGYDWLSYTTNTATETQKTTVNDVFGKLRYDAWIGYNPTELPIHFRAYATDSNPVYFKRNPSDVGTNLMNSNLIDDIEGKYKAQNYGASLIFEPDRARTATLRGLPRLHLEYNETFMKSLGTYYQLDYKIKNISVAGLSKGSNWLQFRTTDYVDNLYPLNNYEQKQFQVGLVDPRGNRLWSALTNWITVSADGQFTNRKGANGLDEYDLNFMAFTTRRDWQARTFMNYARSIATADDMVIRQETTAKVPLFLRGTYGPDTNWFSNVSFVRGERIDKLRKEETSSDTLSVGATTFNREKFTLTPKLTVTSYNNYSDDFDGISLRASLETHSTARYSRTTGLAALTYFDYRDDGSGLEAGKIWRQHLTLNASYRPDSKFSYLFKQDMAIGEGSAPYGISAGSAGNRQFFSSRTQADLAWTPSANLSHTLRGYYDYNSSGSEADRQELTLSHRFSYNNRNTFYRFNTTYTRINSGADSRWGVDHSGDMQYRPDRYNDGLLRYAYSKQTNTIYTLSNDSISSDQRLELLERYNYNIYSRSGVVRRLATLSQEFKITGYEKSGNRRYNYYAMLSGSYSPTSRLSLSGSASYANNDAGDETFYYTAGLGVDFKLLTTNLEYARASRPSDSRVEDRFSATVRRVF